MWCGVVWFGSMLRYNDNVIKWFISKVLVLHQLQIILLFRKKDVLIFFRGCKLCDTVTNNSIFFFFL